VYVKFNWIISTLLTNTQRDDVTHDLVIQFGG